MIKFNVEYSDGFFRGADGDVVVTNEGLAFIGNLQRTFLLRHQTNHKSPCIQTVKFSLCFLFFQCYRLYPL